MATQQELYEAAKEILDSLKLAKSMYDKAGVYSTSMLLNSESVKNSTAPLRRLMEGVSTPYVELMKANEEAAKNGDKFAEYAQAAQNASNPLGVVNSFVKFVSEVDEKRGMNIMENPAIYMFTSKILDMLGNHP